MRVIGVDDKGNVIIEKTCSTGRTEKIILMAETASAIWEFGKAVAKIFQEIVQALTPAFQQFAEEYIRLLNTVQSQGEQQFADIAELSRIKSQTRQQAKSTLKYKRYELRIYRKAGFS